MTAMTTTRFPVPSRQRGMGIVEVMVGILIGMIVVAAIYNVFAVAEGYKRTAVGAAEAQTTGVYAQFVLRREIANAGTALSGAGAELSTCTAPDPGWPIPTALPGWGGQDHSADPGADPRRRRGERVGQHPRHL